MGVAREKEKNEQMNQLEDELIMDAVSTFLVEILTIMYHDQLSSLFN